MPTTVTQVGVGNAVNYVYGDSLGKYYRDFNGTQSEVSFLSSSLSFPFSFLSSFFHHISHYFVLTNDKGDINMDVRNQATLDSANNGPRMVHQREWPMGQRVLLGRRLGDRSRKELATI